MEISDFDIRILDKFNRTQIYEDNRRSLFFLVYPNNLCTSVSKKEFPIQFN